jgi:hypothetical protein
MSTKPRQPDRNSLLKKLTNDLASGLAAKPQTSDGNHPEPGNDDEISLDDSTFVSASMRRGSNTQQALLYRYGQEVVSDNNNNHSHLTSRKNNTSLPLLGPNKTTHSNSLSTDGGVSFRDAGLDGGKSDNLLSEDAAYYQLGMQTNCGTSTSGPLPKSVKLVSGSQFRNITKDLSPKCGTCEVNIRASKLQKETIRSLKLQVSKLEEQIHLIKLARAAETANAVLNAQVEAAAAGGTHHLSVGTAKTNGAERENNVDKLHQRIQALEDELSKMKKAMMQDKVFLE